jgi:hypothetical protein
VGEHWIVRRGTIGLFPGSAHICQCFKGYLPCGGKLGCSAGNNIQLLPALFTIMLDAINTYLCVFILCFIYVFNFR